MALIVAVHLPVMMAVSAVLIERALPAGRRRRRPSRRQDAGAERPLHPRAQPDHHRTLRRRRSGGFFGLPLAGLPATLVDRLADVASTVALFAMGMSLRRYGLRGNIRAGLLLSAMKLLVQPALVLLLVHTVAPMPPIWAKIAVLASACPTGVNAYLVAARFKTGEALASNAITLSTGLAVFTVSFWIHAVNWL